MFTAIGEVLFGPQSADDLDEFAGPVVAIGLLCLAVTVGAEIVLPGDDVDPYPAAAEMVERCHRRREVGRPPITGPHRDQWLECAGARGECGGHREGVRTSPRGADERALPAVAFEGQRVLGECVETVVAVDGGVAAMTGPVLIGDVPEVFGVGDAHDCFPARRWLRTPRKLVPHSGCAST